MPAGVVASLYLRRELPGEYRPLVAADFRPVVAAVARPQPAVVPLVVAAVAREVVAAREAVVVAAREVVVVVARVLHREHHLFQDLLLPDSHLPCSHALRPLVFSTKTELKLYAARAAYSWSLDLVSPDWLASSGASARWTTIASFNWDSLSALGTNEAYTHFISEISNLLDTYAPLKKLKYLQKK